MKHAFIFAILLRTILPATAQQNTLVNPYPKTINVTGSSEMDVVPDEIYVQVDLKEYKKKGEEKVELDKIKTDFLNKCKSIGIADSLISIASYEGYNYNTYLWRKRKRDPDMYASIAYQVKFRDSKKLDELADLLDDEATANFRIVRTSHSRIQEFRRQLKISAVKAAKEKAIYLTEAINEKLGEAVTVVEPDDQSIYQYAVNARLKSANILEKSGYNGYTNDDQASIDFKKLKLRFEVKILFALK